MPQALRTISSQLTLVIKLLYPLGALCCCLLAWLMILTEKIVAGTRLFYLAGLTLIILLVAFLLVRLKFVKLDGDYLHVAGLFKRGTIPLANIAEVTRYGGYLVEVRLQAPSEFGKSIWFVAKWRPFGALTPHPDIEDIRSAVKRQ
jgi:hypothetical protein